MRVGLTLEEILKATGGQLLYRTDKERWENFCRDSRQIKDGDFFIPIKGEKFDGHDFVDDAVDKGADAYLWDREEDPPITESVTVIKVKDTLRALGDMGRFIRRKWKGCVIGITGSAGKTTTKEMIWAGLTEIGKAFKTPGNYNNLIGVPISLLKLEIEDKYAVVEMGMNEPAEIKKLAEIAKPDWAVITTIGPAHIGAFGSIDDIVKEKGEILFHTKKGAVFPAGFKYLSDATIRNNLKFLTTGPMGEIEVIRKNGKTIMRYEDKPLEFTISFSTDVEYENFTTAIALALLMEIDLGKFVEGIKKNYAPPEGRAKIIKNDEITIIDDSYNANPLSVKRAIDLLRKLDGGTKIVIFGDMMELGKYEEALHREVGRYMADRGVDILIAFGRRAKWAGEEAENKGVNVFYVENMMELEQLIDILKKEGDVILVKASRAMRLERIVSYLLRGQEDAV